MAVKEQVISIGVDGSISGLQRKEGIDLREFGSASIKRATDIVWSEKKQQWFIEIKQAPRLDIQEGKPLIVNNYLLNQILFEGGIYVEPEIGCLTVYFEEYSEAVDMEITILDVIRVCDEDELSIIKALLPV